MNVLVTGAAGFIGSHVCRRLIRQGHQVVGLDLATEADRLADVRDDLALVACDVTEVGSIARLLRGRAITHVVHLAAFLPEAALRERPTRALEANAVGTNTLLDAALIADVERVVYASSDAVSPLTPAAGAPVRPTSLYGLLKFVNEAMASHYSEHFNLPTVGLRFGLNFGPTRLAAGERARLYPSARVAEIIELAIRGGTVECDDSGQWEASWLYVKDAARLVELALLKPTDRRVLNVPGTRKTLRDLIDVLRAEVPGAGEVRFAQSIGERPLASHYFEVDPQEAREALEFQLEWPLPQALRDYALAVRGGGQTRA